jgi:hypothetical protein
MNKMPRIALILLLIAFATEAKDAYFRIHIRDLQVEDGKLPGETVPLGRNWDRAHAFEPYAVLETDGEVYLNGHAYDAWSIVREFEGTALFIRTPEATAPKGTLYLPKPDLSGMTPLKFTVRSESAKPISLGEFLDARREHYRILANRRGPGAAWFRHQAAQTTRPPTRRTTPDFDSNSSEVESTFELFSGGRAVSENLQLDRVMAQTAWGEESVALSNISSITIREMDWEPLIKGAKPELDSLASYVPFDQHVVFFPSFAAMTALLDEADLHGTPMLRWLEPRSEDAYTRERYQKQLCLELNDLSRLLGPQVIKSVAFTGSDPYLRTGSDVGILFEAKSAAVLMSYFKARRAEVRAANPAAKVVQGEIESISYTGIITPDRALSSYVASSGDVVYVCNSLYQLRALIEVAKAKRKPLASLAEYVFFRHRYRATQGDEAAFLVLTDATIRRWCGPQWRIGESRRTRIAAALAELQAANLHSLVAGTNLGNISWSLPQAGHLELASGGVLSSRYGSLEFLTPISELDISKVTKEEAQAYERWREGYQRNWQQFFDPIAVRVTMNARQLEAEITVMPLIARSDYNEFLQLTTGATIQPDAGDRHADSLLHFAMSINTQSSMFKDAGKFLGGINPAFRVNPLAWMGGSLSIYADEDPFWAKLQLQKEDDNDDFLTRNLQQLPVALHCEVQSPLGVAAFLSSLRGYVEQSAPQMTRWHNAEHRGQAYVKVAGPDTPNRGDLANLAIYYAVTPKSLVVTLNEGLLKRALDRHIDRTNRQAIASAVQPWLGTNLCLQVNQKFFGALEAIFGENYQQSQQLLSWNNLAILNEWKRLYPKEDPVKLHEKFWQARLVCPGGGSYVWNPKWHTMESTVYGHPGEPKLPGNKSLPLDAFNAVNFGVTFEHQGLSAKVQLQRSSKSTATQTRKVAANTP